jgi:DNA polymerase III epsilon subunit-like protein
MEEASRVHGITAEMLQCEGRAPEEVFAAFLAYIDGCILAGHNVSYDVNIVRSQMRRLGLSWPAGIRTFDTLELCRRFFNLPRYTLTAVCQSLSLPSSPPHRAVDDVNATFDQYTARPDRFGILGQERPLLRRHRSTDCRQQQQTNDDPDAAISSCSRGQHVFQHSVS